MERSYYKNIRTVLGEPMADVRYGLRTALVNAGFEQIWDTGNASLLRNSIISDGADLLVCDCNFADGDFATLIRQVRHGEIGNNPFVAIITLVPAAVEQLIRKAISSGTDDILVKPISPARLMDRIGNLMRERKPFVVTCDYIGPDRRTNHRPGTQEIPKIDVPNPLRAMATEKPDRGKFNAEVAMKIAQLNDQKVERYAFQTVYLVKKIVKVTSADPTGEGVRADLERLAWVSRDLVRRVKDSKRADWADRCGTLAAVMKRVGANSMTPSAKDLNELRGLADAFADDIPDALPMALLA